MRKGSIMNSDNIISLLGGVAMFLFGMSVMGDSLKKVAGSKMEGILNRLAKNPIQGILLGTGVTAAIQSSSATSVMVVGFVTVYHASRQYVHYVCTGRRNQTRRVRDRG